MLLKVLPPKKNQLNLLIGGHYNFPNLPSEFALNSLEFMARVKAQNPTNSILFSFINDIRFSNFCSIGACEIDLFANRQIATTDSIDLDALTTSQVKNYDRQFSVFLPQLLAEKIVTIIAEGDLKALSAFIIDTVQPNITINKNREGMKLSALYYIVQASKQYLMKGYKPDLVFAMDYFLYCYDKDKFIPFHFKQNFDEVGVIWEKNIYNLASKTIRKMYERNVSQNLSVVQEENSSIFTCSSYEGSTIDLRREESSPQFNAINKCPLIIATLYYKLITAHYKKANNLNIYYIIPSYDRSRVNLGTEAFYNIYYDDLAKNVANLNVNIHNVYWIESQPTVQIIDTYNKAAKTISIHA